MEGDVVEPRCEIHGAEKGVSTKGGEAVSLVRKWVSIFDGFGIEPAKVSTDPQVPRLLPDQDQRGGILTDRLANDAFQLHLGQHFPQFVVMCWGNSSIGQPEGAVISEVYTMNKPLCFPTVQLIPGKTSW